MIVVDQTNFFFVNGSNKTSKTHVFFHKELLLRNSTLGLQKIKKLQCWENNA